MLWNMACNRHKIKYTTVRLVHEVFAMRSLQLSVDRSSSIALVLPGSWIDRLDAEAGRRGVTRSALIREAIDMALFPKESAAECDNQEQPANGHRGGVM